MNPNNSLCNTSVSVQLRYLTIVSPFYKMTITAKFSKNNANSKNFHIFFAKYGRIFLFEKARTEKNCHVECLGLRKAKVPLMVYSCGGFSRCFRVARFYDAEGPPVGIVYERPEDERRSLNPDL